MANERIIKVTGKGNLKVKPDVTRITITLEGQNKEYDKTLEQSSKDTEALKDILEKQGFDRTDVKTLMFNVDTRYESYQTKDKSWRERFVGYEFKHVVKVEFDSDDARLGKILYALANARGIHPDFRLSYTVKDPEASKNELLGKAVADAKAKAEVLTKAAGVNLKEIKNIDYSWGEIQFEYSPMHRDMICNAVMAEGCGSFDMDIEPDDIDVSDTVTVVWEIE
ncbi:SIMPL domain-containing protein [Butyrivibrio proteoclasticus]|uniref:SIMPL domain-containing protein n=1 Tax=Butyrivibrio proteoclasticus TaxID=43305 RepID=UPI00054DACAF|nr:SIMPL domain-containing protein [Butyrivibrio proteoclasticus]